MTPTARTTSAGTRPSRARGARRGLALALALGAAACSSTPMTTDGASNADGARDGAGDGPAPDRGVDAGAGDTAIDAGADGTAIVSTLISGVAGAQFESETHLVASPQGRLLAVWMAIGPSGLSNAYALSADGGKSWSGPLALGGSGSLGDPIATVGTDGSFYYGYLSGDCSAGCAKGHVWVARAAPGQTTFDAPVDASPADPAEFYDKPWLMTGSDGSLVLIFGARQGSYPNNIDRVVAARSTDNGKTWTRSDAVPERPAGELAAIPHACISSTGSRVWLLHIDSASPTYATLRWSDDLGASWPAENASSDFALSAEAATLQSFDLRCVGEGDDVWVEYGLAGANAASDSAIPPIGQIRVAHSADGGKTFGTRATITQAGQLYLRPELLREPSGALDVIAYAGTSEGDSNGALRWWRSDDGGKTFVERDVLHQPLLFTGERAGQDWIGDYSGLAFDRGALITSFVNNASGAARIHFVRAIPD